MAVMRQQVGLDGALSSGAPYLEEGLVSTAYHYFAGWSLGSYGQLGQCNT